MSGQLGGSHRGESNLSHPLGYNNLSPQTTQQQNVMPQVLHGDYQCNHEELNDPWPELGGRQLLDSLPREKWEQYHRRPSGFVLVKQTTSPSWYANFRKFEGPINLDTDGNMPQYHFASDSDGEPSPEDDPPNPYGDESYTSDPSYVSVITEGYPFETALENNNDANVHTSVLATGIGDRGGDNNNSNVLVSTDKYIENDGGLSFSSAVHSTPIAKESGHPASAFSYRRSTNMHLSTPTGRQTTSCRQVPPAPTKPRRPAIRGSADIAQHINRDQHSIADSGNQMPRTRNHADSRHVHGTGDDLKSERHPFANAIMLQSGEPPISECVGVSPPDEETDINRNQNQTLVEGDPVVLSDNINIRDPRELEPMSSEDRGQPDANEAENVYVLSDAPVFPERQAYMFRLGRDTDRDDQIFKFWYMAPDHSHVTRFMHLLHSGDEAGSMFLWNPRVPDPSVHTTEQRIPRKTDIGDIGYLDEWGMFHTIFNIFLSREENAAVGLSPPPQHSPLPGASSFKTTKTIQKPHHYIGGSGIKFIKREAATFTFSVDPEKNGAIIVLPEGGSGSTMSISKLRAHKQYFFNHVQSWYDHTNRENGSLFCLTSVVFTHVWGMLVTDPLKSPKKPKKMSLTYSQYGDNRYNYCWDGRFDHVLTSTGPISGELNSLEPNTSSPRHCICITPGALWMDEGRKPHLSDEVKQAISKFGDQLSVPSGPSGGGNWRLTDSDLPSRHRSRSNSPVPSHTTSPANSDFLRGSSRPSSPMLYSSHPSAAELSTGNFMMPLDRFSTPRGSLKKISIPSSFREAYNSLKKSTSRSSKKSKGSGALSVENTNHPVIDFNAHRTDNYFSDHFQAR